MIIGLGWAYDVLPKSLRFWIGIGIKSRCPKARAGPEATTAYFVRIRFNGNIAHQVRRPRMLRGGTAGKPCDCKIETSPKEVDRTRFAEKAPTELSQDPVRLQEDTPAALCVL